ncbi:phytase [Luteimonas huabeiensis]|uniref:phytase n=1 Tax=Luteimonas huabeiensis TaxID=1244513 RepID=UPI0004BC07FE|nr:phytase [Luteimonas huabeiensis]
MHQLHPIRRWPALACLAVALAACSPAPQPQPGTAPAADEDAEDRQDRVREAARAPSATDARVVEEAFLTEMTPDDNVDSPAAWTAPDGATWVFATAKSTDRVIVYDGDTGATLRHLGESGTGPGQFRRPNGVAVVDDVLLVVERDNRRVQAFSLPELAPLGSFGEDSLALPYGVWADRGDEGIVVYVTDAYMAGEDAEGEDILPPLDQLDRRVRRFAVTLADGRVAARDLGAFGDTTPEGALRVVESIWGDPAHDRLLIAEEDETYANELKVYDLSGRYAGRTLGRDVFKAQAEGIALRSCDDGSGWWLTTEQGTGRTVFHLFDRETLDYVGGVAGAKVANTDGIWLQDATRAFPEGVLYAVHDDQGMVAFDWRDIARALDLPACGAGA